jgi:hypothetical protein
MAHSICYIQCSTKPFVDQKFEFLWTNIASTMACPNFKNGRKNGRKNGLPLGVNIMKLINFGF